MNNRIASVIWEALKVALTIWGVLAVDPWVEVTLPKVEAGWRYLISAVVAATLLELILQLALGWPRIKIQWEDKGESAPISGIVARVSKRKKVSQVFILKVSTPPGGWLGYQIMKLWMRLDVSLQIRIERVAVTPTVERSSLTHNIPSVTPDDESNGVTIKLGSPPRRPGKWHWADVRWEIGELLNGVDVNVDCVLHHRNCIIRWLLWIFVWRSTNVRHFQVERA